ncbi:MAG: class I SAM-dependent methyltransferase [bacterium]
MEERKIKEINYYDKHAEQIRKNMGEGKQEVDFEGFNPLILSSFRFLYQLVQGKCSGKKLLDYGCGHGIHSFFPARHGAEVTGIDLSEESLIIARELAKREDLDAKVKFLKMDCEALEFPDDSFDIIFDGGTFSSIDLAKAFPELVRVLQPDGQLVGIETFGHNPFTNLKRKINIRTGKRTEWAASHIFDLDDLKLAEQFFAKIEIYYFHIISWMAFPFLNLPGGEILLRLLEKVDKILSLLPFLKKYAFKVVFVLSAPRKVK